MILVVMGVSGSGKTALALALVERTGWEYAEGDDYHSAANKAKMAGGAPLTDEDRWPWLDALRGVLAAWQREGKSGIMTCSALKQTYRNRLASGLSGIRFVWLDADRETLARRLNARRGHFMNPGLLESQLSALEPPAGANTLRLTGGDTTEQVDRVLNWTSLSIIHSDRIKQRFDIEDVSMAKVTLVFAVLLVVLGLVGYFGTGRISSTALIPTWWGLAMGVCGFLAISPSESRRKIFMHVNVTIGALGCIGAFIEALRGYGAARPAGLDPDMKALAAKLAMAILLLIYVNLCVRSFIQARRSR